MAQDRTRTQHVVVVTGGAIGIGAAIAEEFGRRGSYVVTMDPVVALDGSPQASSEQTTAQRIVDAGGAARASSTSVTDADAVHALFHGLVEEFGALDAVVNVAGISRPTGFASGSEEDWTRVLDVHLNGYLTVLRVALPLMAAARYGRILGVTSGSGWRAADAGAYSCAKRAVAALTWQIGQAAPDGVAVNALSPIAATRMVANALSRQAGSGDTSGRSAASGGVALSAAPPPENLGPIGAYLAGDEFAWCRGQVMFSNGSEVSAVSPPRVLEALRTDGVASIAGALATAVPVAFSAAEAAQVSNGGSVPRLGAAFDTTVAPGDSAPSGGRCVIVTADDGWRDALGVTLASRGMTLLDIKADTTGFVAVAEALAVATDAAPIDAVVVALTGTGTGAATDDDAQRAGRWQQMLEEHAGITDDIRADASWVRAVAEYSARAERPVRIVTITSATTAGGRSRAMAAAQLARSAHGATSGRVDAFAIAVETGADSGRLATAELVGHLVSGADAGALSGAELVATSEWLGLRSHPSVAGTVSYGGPELPEWIDSAVHRIVNGEFEA